MAGLQTACICIEKKLAIIIFGKFNDSMASSFRAHRWQDCGKCIFQVHHIHKYTWAAAWKLAGHPTWTRNIASSIIIIRLEFFYVCVFQSDAISQLIYSWYSTSHVVEQQSWFPFVFHQPLLLWLTKSLQIRGETKKENWVTKSLNSFIQVCMLSNGMARFKNVM